MGAKGSAALALVAAAAVGLAAVPAAQAVPLRTRYAPALRCLTAGSVATGKPVRRAGNGYRAAGPGRPTSLFFQPTGLGTYLIEDASGGLLTRAGAAVQPAGQPGIAGEWAARVVTPGVMVFRGTSDRRVLALDTGSGALVAAAPGTAGPRTRFRLAGARRCHRFPEAATGAYGLSGPGRNRDGTLFGYADPHMHLMADLRAGGQTVYGEAFDRFGISEALGHDADVHGPNGSLDITGNLLRTGSPTGTHDTNGWPSFTGWPTYNTYTHQQAYYVWLERAWRAGLRLLGVQLVEDEPLCRIEPRRSHSCDETTTIELQARRVRALQDYVDAHSGGPGHGWFRIVTSPAQARRVIAGGRLAVILGVEASDPWGCSEFEGVARCDRAGVDRGIALYRRLGIRATFITHWIDNAFGGAALEEGAKGTFIASMQLSETGRPFSTGPCPEKGQGTSCNTAGLTDLGAYAIRKMMDAGMLIEADHLSEHARLAVLKIAEQRHYPLVSSHTNTGGIWTPSDLRRLHAVGGIAVARPDTPARLAATILRLHRVGHFTGIGMGTDTGGFAALPPPGSALPYPFRSYDGRVRFVRERTGRRSFDLFRDGVAHYGLFPDLIAAMGRVRGGRAAQNLLFRSADAYVRTWARATARVSGA